MTTLTPPADAPPPWDVYVDPHYGPAILDVNGETIGGIGMDRDLAELAEVLPIGAAPDPDHKQRQIWRLA